MKFLQYALVNLLLVLCAVNKATAQTDTTYTFYDNEWDTCHVDTATYISKTYANGNKFVRADYWVKENQLQSLAYSSDAAGKKPVDTAIWYNKAGVVIETRKYTNEKITYISHNYDDGKRKAIATFDADGKTATQNGWDEAGNELPNYIYEKEAVFPGGPEAWRNYLVSKINPKTAARTKAPLGIYTVKVQFVVNKQGKVERATAVSIPPECPKCGVEAVKIIMGSPTWENAIQFNRPVIYQAIQNISWEVAE